MDGLRELMEIAQNLGTPGITIVSIAAVIVWLARQAIALRKDLEQSKIDSANALLKVWSELEGKRPSGSDPNYDAIKDELLKRFGIKRLEKPSDSALEVPDAVWRMLPPRVTLLDRTIYSVLGAMIAQFVRLLFSFRGAFSLDFYYLVGLFLSFVLFSMISALIVLFVLGDRADRRTYLVAGVLAGLSVPYLVFAVLAPESPMVRHG
jgi:hypothetical protein